MKNCNDSLGGIVAVVVVLVLISFIAGTILPWLILPLTVCAILSAGIGKR